MLRPWKTIFLTTALIGMSLPLSAQAVYTKRCPEQISLHFSAPSLTTEKEIRENPRYHAFTEAMFQDVLRSKVRFESLVMQDLAKTDFVITERKNGRCTYSAVHAAFQSAQLTLFTASGVDYLKEEVSVLQNLIERKNERFSVQAVMDEYSTTSITLSPQPALLFTTIEHGCYDRVCVSDVGIGEGKLTLKLFITL